MYGTFAEKDCMNVRIKGVDLEQAILANVNAMADVYADSLEKGKATVSETEVLSDSIRSLQKEQDWLSARKMRLYEEYRSGGNRDEYLKRKTETENRLVEIAEKLSDLELNLETARQNDVLSSSTQAIFQDVKFMKSFDKVQLKKIIDRVNVYGPDRIEIIWKPTDALFQRISAGSGFVDL